MDDYGIWDGEILTAKEVATIYSLGLFEGLDLADGQLDDFITAFDGMSSVAINSNLWQYTTGLGSEIGDVGGSPGSNAFVVLDSSGAGMQIIPEPSSCSLWALIGVSSALVLGWRCRSRRSN